MPLFLLPIISFLSNLISPLTTFLKNRAEVAAASHQLDMAKLAAATELAKVSVAADAATLTAQLGATSSGFKDVTFVLLMIPIIVTCLFPSAGKDIFHNLSQVPEYYQWLVLSVYGAIWGIKNVILPVSNNSVAKKLINKQEFFQYLRSTKGPLSDAEVKDLVSVIDKLEQDNTK